MNTLFFGRPENQKLYTYNTAYFGAKIQFLSDFKIKDKKQTVYFPKEF